MIFVYYSGFRYTRLIHSDTRSPIPMFKLSGDALALVIAGLVALGMVVGAFDATHVPSPSTTTVSTLIIGATTTISESYSVVTVPMAPTATTTMTTSLVRQVVTTETTTVLGKIPTSVAFTCDQNSIGVGQDTHCRAFVSSSDGNTPAGTVSFSSNGAGVFEQSDCHQSPSSLDCNVSYTPSSSGGQTLTAEYSGDQFRASSNGSYELSVS